MLHYATLSRPIETNPISDQDQQQIKPSLISIKSVIADKIYGQTLGLFFNLSEISPKSSLCIMMWRFFQCSDCIIYHPCKLILDGKIICSQYSKE